MKRTFDASTVPSRETQMMFTSPPPAPPPEQVDPLGHAVEAGAIQEIRADAAQPSRRDPPVDQDPSFQRSGRRNEQQDQVNQPPLVRVPNSRELHCSHLSLLRPPPASRRALITLLG